MKKLLAIAFTLSAFRAVATDITLQGTIGKYPVVLNISTDDDGTCKAKYFYLSSLHDIYLKGTGGKMTFTFSVAAYDDRGKSTGTESFSLVKDSKGNFSGAWKKGKEKVLPVSLHPAVLPAQRNPYINYSSVKDADTYDLLRTAEMKIIKDSTARHGAYTLSYIHIAHSKVGIMQFADGPDMHTLSGINEQLMDKFISYAMMDFSCELDNYYFTNPYITAQVFSINFFSSYYCNGAAHPDFGDEPLNLDMRTGKELALEDVLYISDKPVPNEKNDYDAWSIYKEKVYASKIIELMTKLHPVEMKPTPPNDDSDCDYSGTDTWQHAEWFVTDTGLYISPSVSTAMRGPCRDPDWSVILFDELKKYPTPHSGIKLEK